ncbi:hypothetical protein FRC12_014543 [Ceratobasidium sp. 428]|nr:hypothetical protein FRC12_014543 [Ceratobasidium sp. 428]
MHRRKTSKEVGENGEVEEKQSNAVEERYGTPLVEPETPPTASTPNGHSSPHARSHTLPGHGPSPRIPSSPSRLSPAPQRAPSLNTYDRLPPSAPSNKQTFSTLAPPPVTSIPMNRHNRAPSVYEPLYGSNPPSAPPMRQTFGLPTSPTKLPASPFRVNGFPPPPSPSTGSSGNGNSPQGVGMDSRRRSHARVHSRNLSVYFPRPGATSGSAVASIAEDGDGDGDIDAEGQEIEVGVNGNGQAPIQLIPPPNANGGPRGFGDGFRFGGLPADAGVPAADGSGAAAPKRRGHHHKHSLSHNFFSFMEPGAANGPKASQTFPSLVSPIPATPWGPITPFPHSSTTPSFPQFTSSSQNFLVPDPPRRARSPLHAPHEAGHLSTYVRELPPGSKRALVFGVMEFMVGAAMWVAGQRKGSLACTGLGYWVVFDAMGVAMGVVGRELREGDAVGGGSAKLPFGTARLEVTMLFAQVVYLMFAAVYICKETVEHLLLAAGSSHHHHTGDDDAYTPEGLLFPNLLLCLSTLCILFAGLVFQTHDRLVLATGSDLPSLSTLFRSSSSSSSSHSNSSSGKPRLQALLDNPFCVAPVVFGTALLAVSTSVVSTEHRSLDLALAAAETLITWMIAYPSALALGKVLLQTAPERGMRDARIEGFLRVMRELERHPQIMHLPAPRLWRLTPTSGALVATVELHVRRGTDDAAVLALTRYAYERCIAVVGRGGGPGSVTVSVVRG